jgi:DNA (cytosine-5)-methyltransferase 1
MNVLSLFDGMSCGQLALNRIGIKYDKYFASEIDKYAMTVTMANFPNTIQLGSVVDLDTSKLPKIDLLIGGSPCQSFSFAGKRKGMTTKDNIEILELSQYLKLKEENFQFEGQSYLFWEYMRILNEVKPKYFLLENVTMAERWSKILTKAIGVSPILINSSLLSAQNRERLYWTNIGLEPKGLFGDLHSIIEQPKDKQLILKDILLENPDPKYYVSDKVMAWIERPRHSFKLDIRSEHQKGKTVLVGGRGNTDLVKIKEPENNEVICGASRGRLNDQNEYEQQFEIRNDNKTNCLTTVAKDNFILSKEVVGLKEVRSEEAKQIRKENNKKGIDTNPYRKKDLIERNDGKTGAILTSLTNDNLIKESLLVEDLSMYKRNAIITHNQNQIVTVRKNEVDIPNLQILLKKHKKKGITIDYIAKSLNVPKTMVEHWFRTDNGFSIPNPEIWLSLKELLSIENNDFDASIMEFEEKEGNYDKANRVYDEEGKSPTLTLQSSNDKILSRNKLNFVGGIDEPKRGDGNLSGDYRQEHRVYHEVGKAATAITTNKSNYYISNQDNYRIRRLTPIECERLQTVPDNYTSFVSDTQRYKMLGNGWTIDVIAHIFSYIKK